MISKAETLRFGNVGSRWLPLTLTTAMILMLVAWLLDALHDAQEMAEKTVVEVTVRNMRVGLQLAMGDAMMHGQEAQIHGWAGGNPAKWLGTLPEGYQGECSAAEAEVLKSGAWCFDRDRQELVYAPRTTAHLKLGSGTGQPRLRWRVIATPPLAAGQRGLRVENVTPYEWILN